MAFSRINRRTVVLFWLIAAAVASLHKTMQYVSGWGVSSRGASFDGSGSKSSSRVATKSYNEGSGPVDPYAAQDNGVRATAATMFGGYLGAWAAAAAATIAVNPVVGIPAVSMVAALFIISLRRSSLSKASGLPWEPFGVPKDQVMPWEPYGAPTGPQGWQVAPPQAEEQPSLAYAHDLKLTGLRSWQCQESSPDLAAWARNKVLWRVDPEPEIAAPVEEQTEYIMTPSMLRECINIDQAVSVLRSDKTWCPGTVVDVKGDSMVTVKISGTTKMKNISGTRVQDLIKMN